MLKQRHRRIQKYISAVKGKKPRSLRDHKVLAYSLNNNNQSEQKQIQPQKQLAEHVYSAQDVKANDKKSEKACWHEQEDSSGKLYIGQKNKFKKLDLQQHQQGIEQALYEERLTKMYKNSHKMKDWANVQPTQMQGQQEKDINDYLNQEMYEKNKSDSEITVQFHSRSQQKHQSIVTGLDWSKNVLFSSGLDQKLKIWSVRPGETNPELKMNLEKDFYMKDLPLSSCFFKDHQVYCGTLRKTVAVLDTEKWKTRFITSSYMNNHKTYQNLRINRNAKNSPTFSLHSQNTITLFDNNFSYVNSFYTNEDIMDVVLKGNQVISVSDTSFYSWDTRMMKINKMFKTNLGYTKICASGDSTEILAIGSRLGNVYLYDYTGTSEKSCTFTPYAQVKNLLTHITGVESSRDIRYPNLMISMSKWKANAARIIDFAKGKCIGNWPTNKTKISFSTVGSFSQTGMFSIGSTNGYVNVFKLK